jgi:hypothetical protein
MILTDVTSSRGHSNLDSGGDDTIFVGIQKLLFGYKINSTFQFLLIYYTCNTFTHSMFVNVPNLFEFAALFSKLSVYVNI